MHKLQITNIQEEGNVLVVTLPHTKPHQKRVFTVLSEGCVNGVELYRKYAALRPSKVTHPYVFLGMRNGKCTVQRVGINSFYRIPRVIAEYLKLENPEQYTGHSLRRSSATILADQGADMTTLKRFGGWSSDKVATGYVEDSLEQKIKIARKILIDSSVSVSSCDVVENGVETATKENHSVELQGPPTGFIINSGLLVNS